MYQNANRNVVSVLTEKIETTVRKKLQTLMRMWLIIKTESFSSNVGNRKNAPMSEAFTIVLKVLPMEGRTPKCVGVEKGMILGKDKNRKKYQTH